MWFAVGRQFKQRNETFGLCVLVVRVAHPHADEVVQMGQTYLRSSRIFWRIIKIFALRLRDDKVFGALSDCEVRSTEVHCSLQPMLC